MTIEVKVPLLPESISDATISTWHKKAGDRVSRDENIVDLETDKVMLEVPAPADGILKTITKEAGTTVQANEVIAIIDEAKADKTKPAEAEKAAPPSAKTEVKSREEQREEKQPTATKTEEVTPSQKAKAPEISASSTLTLGPSARRAAAEHAIDVTQVAKGTGGRVTKENIISSMTTQPSAAMKSPQAMGDRPEQRVPMTRIRIRIAERLLEVTQNTAMLTTFNEINMSAIMELRNRYRDKFEKKYNVRLGLMSFFVKACVEALKRSPVVNASIDGNDIIYHGYYDIGVAVSTDRGLVVPVLRDADKMNMAEIETKIIEYAEKARSGKLSLEEMQGGTFTITNGGVFGSLMATPIINAPQCAILGMHKIQERPIVENGQIVARPMMYVALSYDHRLIDGKESVTFLVSIKEFLEDPTRIILDV